MARYKRVGMSPRLLLQAVLLGYSQGLVSSRSIERACRDNVLFVAITGDAMPHVTTIAAVVSRSRDAIAIVFAQVLANLGKAAVRIERMKREAEQIRTWLSERPKDRMGPLRSGNYSFPSCKP